MIWHWHWYMQSKMRLCELQAGGITICTRALLVVGVIPIRTDSGSTIAKWQH